MYHTGDQYFFPISATHKTKTQNKQKQNDTKQTKKDTKQTKKKLYYKTLLNLNLPYLNGLFSFFS